MLPRNLLLQLERYLEENRIQLVLYEALYSSLDMAAFKKSEVKEIDKYINSRRQEKFNRVLFRFIDRKEAADAEIYKKAGIDRRHFSKIRSNPDYRPGKPTVIALALALELHQEDFETLLNSAGYTLSPSSDSDLIIKFFVEQEIFDTGLINQFLVEFKQKPLLGIQE